MRRTPLESWIGGRILAPGSGALTRELVQSYQLEKLRELVSYARSESPFYRDRFAGVEGAFRDLEAFAALPFTTAEELRQEGAKLLCTAQNQIERVVTLQSSGTTGEAKRLFFTGSDLELTVDFFSHGMSTMVDAGQTVIIFLPGERPDSVGDLLARGLKRIGVNPVLFGPVRDPDAARQVILRHPSSCLVGIPTQILALARGDLSGAIPRGWVASVLLSTDYIPEAIEREIGRLWGSRLFAHYGMTETGLGGGVECEAGDGYHLREADLYTEIVDPQSGRPLPDGSTGEVVFTTLTRKGMPLLRYRTGDLARIIPAPCPCGTVLKRLGRITGRIAGEIPLGRGGSIGMPALDEALFPIEGVLNFSATLTENEGEDQLHLCLHAVKGMEERVARGAVAALSRAETVGRLFRERRLTVGSITFSDADWFTSGVGKRRIADHRLPSRASGST